MNEQFSHAVLPCLNFFQIYFMGRAWKTIETPVQWLRGCCVDSPKIKPKDKGVMGGKDLGL